LKDVIHVAIVEDDDEIRQILSLIIDGSPGFSCKHTFGNAESAIDKLPQLYIDVVLMDIELPEKTGIEAVYTLKHRMEEVDFIMLTIKQDDDSVFNSLCAGATGYLLKETSPVDILNSIKDVVKGGSPISTNIARKIIHSFNSPKAPSPLSNRETEILTLLCGGHNYKSIAEKLFLSAHTVKTHIKNIYKKLHVNTRAEAVSKAIKDKLI